MPKPYKGKYPERVHTVYGATIAGQPTKHVLYVRLNNGAVYTAVPHTQPAPMPKPGMSKQEVEKHSTLTPHTVQA
jgi:hypothetical protein